VRPPRIDIIYEGDELIVIDKPSGLPSIAAEGSRAANALSLVTQRIRVRNPKGRAAVVHRLDRDTSGVMVFAANARAKAELMAAWNELVLCRRYVALVEGGLPDDEGFMDDWLIERSIGRVSVGRQGDKCAQGPAQRALSRYRVLKRGAAFSLVELELDTGRKHQIRAQLASRGCPVAGDERYGSRRDPAGRLCLHASLLELKRHPDAEALRFESPVPQAFYDALRSAEADTPRGGERSGGGGRAAAAKRGAADAVQRRSPAAGTKAGRSGSPGGGPSAGGRGASRGASQGGGKGASRNQEGRRAPAREEAPRGKGKTPPKNSLSRAPGAASRGPRKSSSR
jgi:23S rRNA pseudouridine1911/1915/1917 synthase